MQAVTGRVHACKQAGMPQGGATAPCLVNRIMADASWAVLEWAASTPCTGPTSTVCARSTAQAYALLHLNLGTSASGMPLRSRMSHCVLPAPFFAAALLFLPENLAGSFSAAAVCAASASAACASARSAHLRDHCHRAMGRYPQPPCVAPLFQGLHNCSSRLVQTSIWFILYSLCLRTWHCHSFASLLAGKERIWQMPHKARRRVRERCTNTLVHEHDTLSCQLGCLPWPMHVSIKRATLCIALCHGTTSTHTHPFDICLNTLPMAASCINAAMQYHMRAHLLILLGELRRAAIGAQLMVQLVCARLDGHARAVEALREEHPLAAQPVVCARELQLRAGTCE